MIGPRGLGVAGEVPAARFRQLERDLLFAASKWDPQVGDVAALAPYALRLDDDAWDELARGCEALAAEALAAESAILASDRALAVLGLPGAVVRALRAGRSAPAPTLARVMRFDVHPTADGWAVSEVNADVPGGYAEASDLPRRLADELGGRPCGDPVAALADAAVARADGPGPIGLVHATAYADDRQVADAFATALAARGREAVPVAPDRLAWTDDGARLDLTGRRDRLAGLWRFFPAEWLPNLPRRAGWARFFGGATPPACNPGRAVVLQSKRWTLAAAVAGVDLPTWARWHAEVAPVDARRRSDPGWVLKPALGRVGEGIGLAGVTPDPVLRGLRAASWAWPRAFVVQRRFESVPLATPDGPVHACLGVYVVDGRAAGVYGRVARRALVDGAAREVAVLRRGGVA